jgi:hypothetical protein
MKLFRSFEYYKSYSKLGYAQVFSIIRILAIASLKISDTPPRLP